VTTHIVFLAETEEAADLARTLGPKALRVNGIRHARDIVVALLDNGKSQYGQVHGNNASANRLPLPLASSSRAVAAVALGQQQTHTRRVHDTLLHRETLLVIAAGDLEDVALEFVADAVARDFLTHAAVHEHAKLALIFDVNQLLRAVGRVGDVELHLDGVVSRCGCGGKWSSVGEMFSVCGWLLLIRISALVLAFVDPTCFA